MKLAYEDILVLLFILPRQNITEFFIFTQKEKNAKTKDTDGELKWFVRRRLWSSRDDRRTDSE